MEPFLDDAGKYESMLIKTLKPRLQRADINEGALQRDFSVV